MTLDDVEAIYNLVKGVNSAAIIHVGLDATNFLYECNVPACSADYLYAYDGTYATIDHFMQNIFAPPGSLGEDPNVGIEDGSGKGNGASGRWVAIFGDLGWSTQDLGRVPTTSGTEVIDQSGGTETAAAKWFAAYFGVPVTTAPPPSPGATGSADGVIVILGQDEESAFNHDPGYGS
jgi:hypothetical protein